MPPTLMLQPSDTRLAAPRQVTDIRSLQALRGQRGVTLLELLIVLGVIGMIVAVGYLGLGYALNSDLREETTQVMQMLRASNNMATTTGKHHRVVIDLDEHTYRIEMCEGDIKLRRGDEEARPDERELEAAADLLQRAKNQDSSIPPEIAQAATPEEAAKMAEALVGTRVGSASCKPPELPTGAADGRGTERALPTDDGIQFRGIWVQHLEGERSSGVVHVNFFPLGYTEKSVIVVGDGDGDVYTLLVHGFTGRVELRTDDVDGEDFMRLRADGEDVDERGPER